jgi:hypothetical protein
LPRLPALARPRQQGALRGAEGEVRKARQALAEAEARLGPARADFERVFGGNTWPCWRCEGARREVMRERRLSHIDWRDARPDEQAVADVIESLVRRRELDPRQGEAIARRLGFTLDDAA